MATHHGKEGVVHAGGTAIGNATGFTIDTTHDIVEDTPLGSSMKSYLAGRMKKKNFGSASSPKNNLIST